MTRFRVWFAWSLLLFSTLGLGVTFPLWLLGLISSRTMLGVTLALSWLALIYEGFNSVQIAHDTKKKEDRRKK